jgi:hypothetical protein
MEPAWAARRWGADVAPALTLPAWPQVATLFQLMSDKKEDDEFVLQIAFTFHKFLLHDETRAALLSNTQQVVFYLVDLLQDKNKEVRPGANTATHAIEMAGCVLASTLSGPPTLCRGCQVRRVADQCLDIIMDTDEEWAVRIRALKFESFNQEWLDVVSQPGGGQGGLPHSRRGGYDEAEVDYSGGDGGPRARPPARCPHPLPRAHSSLSRLPPDPGRAARRPPAPRSPHALPPRARRLLPLTAPTPSWLRLTGGH